MDNFRKLVLKHHLPTLPIMTEIHARKGSHLGAYKYSSKGETDKLIARVDESISEMPYIFGHEYGHGIWFRHFTPRKRLAWIKLYHESVALSDLSKRDLEMMLDDLKSAGDSASYMKACEGDMLVAVKAIFRHIKQVHSIDRHHFDLILMLDEEGTRADDYWPKHLEISEKNVLLTDYAKKNPEELFAETFAMWICGKKLPKRLAALLDKHLRTL
jgi:hypothetical protein